MVYMGKEEIGDHYGIERLHGSQDNDDNNEDIISGGQP